MKLKNYKIQYDMNDEPMYAYGMVYGNPKFEDGSLVRTSKIVDYVKGKYIKTKNSIYELEVEGERNANR